MSVPISLYHIFRLGIKQSRTVPVNLNGTTTGVIVEGDDYLDPAINPTVLDLNGLCQPGSSLTATYGIRDGSIDMSFKERKLFETTTKGKHGGEFTDYQYQNRIIKLTLVINIQPALTAGTSVSDFINNAVQNVRKLFNTAYSYSKSKGVQAGAAAIEGQPVVLMVQLNQTSSPVYFDVMGGEIDTKPLYNAVAYSSGYASFNVDIKCRYAGRGDLVYLQNAVINGNFVSDTYSKSQSYWIPTNNDATHGTIGFYDATTTNALPPIGGTMQNTALSLTGQFNTTSLIRSTAITVSHNEQFIVDFWYTCSSSSGYAYGQQVQIVIQYEEINSSTDNNGAGFLTYVTYTLDLSASGSGAYSTPTAQYQGVRYTSPLLTLPDSHNTSTNPTGLFNIRVVISTSAPTSSENMTFYINQMALWRFPSYAPARLKVAPKTEYVNVIPSVLTDKLTTVYGIRGDVEAGCKIKAEPLWVIGASAPPFMQALSIGMRQKIGSPIPFYAPFASNTVLNFSSGDTTWNKQASTLITPRLDKRSRNYKLILVANTSDVMGFGLKMLKNALSYFISPIFPSQLQPYLPSTGAPGGSTTFTANPQVPLDCGVVAIPADNGGSLQTIHDTTNTNVNLNVIVNFLTGVTGTAQNVNISLFALYFLPADQYCYIDTRHVLGSSGLSDGAARGWAAGAPLMINSTKETVETVVSDFNGLYSVGNFSPLRLNIPLRFYPSQANTWRQTDNSKPVSADDTIPMEIGFFPRLPDNTASNFISKDFNGGTNTDMMMYFQYYPMYGDLNGGN